MKQINFLKVLALLFVATTGLNAQSPFVQWNFNNDDNVANIGSGTLTLVGGTTGTYASGAGSSDTDTPNRGFNTTTYAALGSENKQRGIQIDVSTVGYSDIVLSFDQRLSNTANNTYTVQYTTDVTASAVVWTDMDTLTLVPAETGVGDTWHNERTVSFASITALNNNENAAFRIVSSFDPETNDYRAARSTSNYGTGGTVRYDMVTFSGNVTTSDPVLTLTPATLEFSQTLGDPSSAQSVPVYGANLTEAIALTVTAPFEISLTEEGTYAVSQTLSLTDGEFSGSVFVRLNATETNTFTGTLTAQTTGITPNVEVALNGETTESAVTGPTNPDAFDLSSGDYSFTEWAADSDAGTYPDNMRFWTHENNAPDITTEFTGDWVCVYNLESRSRILGDGTDGISFLQTGDPIQQASCPQGEPGSGNTIANGHIGAAVVALNTTGRENIQVQWTSKTVLKNNRIYAIKFQYRIGNGGGNANAGWTDFDGNAEYVTNPDADETNQYPETFNITLPSEANNQELVQLRWVYYQHESNTVTGTRARLGLDEIFVSSEATASVGEFDSNSFRMYPNPATSVVNFNKEVSAAIFDITGKKVLSFENASSVSVSGLNKGIYIVKTTEGTVSKLIVK